MDQWVGWISGWFRSLPKEEENPAERLAQIWNHQGSGHRVAFLSVVLNIDDSTANEVKDIGLSVWREHGFVHSLTYHWRIVETIETKDVVEFGNPDSFDFGSTHPIKAGDIRTILDDWVSSLFGDCEQVCLVVYGEQQTKTLWKHWRPPAPVTFLDIEQVWRLTEYGPAHATFSELASTIDAVASSTNDLEHAGNQAYCLLVLARALAARTEVFSEDNNCHDEIQD